MIKAVQIQTNDACNSKCIMCPYSEIKHNGKMSDDLFKKIIDNIKSSDIISDDVEVLPFLQNEPLLDDDIFNKIDYIKQNLPNAKISLFTNGILCDKFFKQLAFTDAKILISIYGFNTSTFNRVTGLNISEEKYINMIRTIKKLLSLNSNIRYETSWKDNYTMRTYTSRAGFLNDDKILHTEVSGCKWNRGETWPSILSDGSMILCCMDWRRETVLGNVNDNTIEEILENNKHIFNQINGSKSQHNFICKRCEQAIGDGRNRLIKLDDFYDRRYK